MLQVVFYTKDNCSLCEEARAIILLLQKHYPFELEERDIYTKDEWLEEYQLLIPAVEMNDIRLNCEELTFETLEQALQENS
ncbi:glutaredoxin family protein [Virgibacillus sp. W0181]|uniref:glutaredoxin family protein n=1 Tax=Virgibacillus sp. W0181 TaxID=3391581 RepID=UPI003F482DC4